MSGKRSIFEEVGTEGPKPGGAGPKGGMIGAKSRSGARGAIRIWLVALALLVVAMIAVGGATRLTDSGLSITEWRPVTGAIPPLTEADWQAEFTKYQASPQYRLMNAGMELQAFKTIYWWEWGHRQLGRVLGLVWGLGFLFFWLGKRIPPGWTGRLLGLGALGGGQGAVGWWRVASGLEGQMASVASYRLATHLGLAFVILGLIFWYVLSLSRAEAQLLQARRLAEPRLVRLGSVLLALAFVQVVLGALVAGIDAGRGFTDWPLMGGQVLPPDPFPITPLWRNFFEDPGLVQFVHRVWGYALLLAAGYAVWAGRGSAHAGTCGAFGLLGAMVLLQVVLGIVTVMHGSPMALGLVHQFGAVVTFALIVRARHRARYPLVQSIRGGVR